MNADNGFLNLYHYQLDVSVIYTYY